MIEDGDKETGRECLLQSLALAPEQVELAVRLAAEDMNSDNQDQAELYLEKARVHHPRHGYLLYLLGRISEKRQEWAQAAERYFQAVEFLVNPSEVYSRLSDILAKMERFPEAIDVTRKLLAISPEDVDLRWFYASLLLRSGDFLDGFREEQCRKKDKNYDCYQMFWQQPFWQGQDLRGKTLLVYVEQGFGDVFQYVRYLREFKKIGVKIILSVFNEMLPLFSESELVDTVIRQRPQMLLPRHDYVASIADFPYLLETTLNAIPNEVPYLQVPSFPRKKWRKKLFGIGSGLKIGLVWSANPASSTYERRSMHLSDFAPLTAEREITFFGLQKRRPGEAKVIFLPTGCSLSI